ncbi:hypothetical protein B0E38_02574 [Streptomyces sp. 111WW2]|uniref:hypothetical protein n=1 Tax=Streptomyces sp. 111WW2 TaxID=1945515 RepID=UPI000D2A4991|nr:hypothetical protein [Streptomyces sp. 111WW2]PSK57043.1 hypothetical protein B0E38_02574 [Streptomyces sp. 111WW2]
MGARACVAAVVVFTAAAAAVVVRRREARWRREVVSERLMAGCAVRDSAALRLELDRFRRRLDVELAAGAVVSAAGAVVDEAWASAPSRIDPSQEGGW